MQIAKNILNSLINHKKYVSCINDFLNLVISHNKNNIETIILYGGLVRDKKCIRYWSDIDIIIIFKDILERNANNLAKIINKLENKYSIRLDISQLSLEDLTNDYLLRSNFNSEIINVLSMRENVSIVLFGKMPKFDISSEQEKRAAIFYINKTLNLFRRYLIEFVYKENSIKTFKISLSRIIRWTFSIIRASLRLFNIQTHPYKSSLNYLINLFPELDLALLEELINLRENFNQIEIDFSIFTNIEIFIENYIKLILRRYYENETV